jgi:hypothetical protein
MYAIIYSCGSSSNFAFLIPLYILVEPFVKGTTASTAFCLLFKLWTQRLTVKQLEGLIDHTDSP